MRFQDLLQLHSSCRKRESNVRALWIHHQAQSCLPVVAWAAVAGGLLASAGFGAPEYPGPAIVMSAVAIFAAASIFSRKSA